MFETKLKKKLEGKKNIFLNAEIAGDYRCLSVEAATCIISWIHCKTFIHVMIDPSFYFLFLSQFIVFVFSFLNSCFILPKILNSQRCNTERQQNIIIFFAWQMTNNWSVIDYQFLLTNVLINCVYINVCLLASFCDRGAGAG